jgi:glycosyltransferase involved in cell wall biosynthesis
MIDGPPTVSVVVPTYYRNELLRDALESIRQQTHPSVETIVVDDSGEGNAAEVINEKENINYISLEQNEGPHAARSIGARAATGEFVQFLDDDDLLHREKFGKQIPLFSESVGVVYSGVKIHETGEVKYPDKSNRGDVLEEALKVHLFEPACTCSLLIRRNILNDILPLKNRHGCDDDGLMIELAQRTKFDFVEEPLVTLRKQTEYSVGSFQGGIQGRKRILEMYSDLYDSHPPEVRRHVLFDINRWISKQKLELEEDAWSFRAIEANIKAAYYAPRNRTKRVGLALASVFGQPGVRAAKRAYTTISNVVEHVHTSNHGSIK